MEKFYITTPIYYCNAPPHIGHSYTSVAADVMARFKRLQNRDVFFLTGTDEHGQKVEAAARKVDVEPQFFVDMISADFRDLAKQMNISNDDFIRTTEARHKAACRAFWLRLVDAGTIYLGAYEGWYAARDESFYDESELTKQPDGSFRTIETNVEVEWVSEPSYFFEMTAYNEKVLKYIETHPDLIQPVSKRNEILSILRSGNLRDLSISRTSFSWGVPVPGDPDHVMYVWVDALVNYLSALGFPDAENPRNAYWAPDVHLVGKEIVKFHAIYWLAFLMAAEIDLPKKIFSHGWWTVEGKKISKSAGNALDVRPLIEEFGVDAVRYFLLREMPFGNDGNFSRASFVQRYNSELANDLGNLAQRTLSFVAKQTNGTVTAPHVFYQDDFDFLASINQAQSQVIEYIDKLAFQDALIAIWKVVASSNAYFANNAPWALKKTDIARMNRVLYMTIYALRSIAFMAHSFMPESMDKLLVQLGDNPVSENDSIYNGYPLKDIENIQEPTPIFPRKAIV